MGNNVKEVPWDSTQKFVTLEGRRNRKMEDSKKQIRLCVAVIFGATVLLYFPTLFYNFISIDDGTHLYQNPLILNPTADSLWEFWRKPFFDLYIPLTYSVWWAVSKFSFAMTDTLDPSFFHFLNLAFHFLNSAGVFFLLGIFVPPFPALVGALLFCVHPIQVEAVAWVSCFKDLLSFFLGLCAAAFFLMATQSDGKPSNSKHSSERSYALATFFFVLSLLAKPGMVILPLFLFCLIPLLPHPQRRKNRLAELVLSIWLLGSGAWGWWLTVLQPGYRLSFYIPVFSRWRIAGDALFHYMKQTLIPIGYTPDYARLPPLVLKDPSSLVTWMIPALLGIGIFWNRKRWRREFTGMLIWGIGFIPVLGVIPFAQQTYSTVTDRYAYLPFIGLSLAAASLMDRWSRLDPVQKNRIPNLMAQGVLIGLAWVSISQVKLWKDTLTLTEAMLQLHPDSYQANYSRGGELYDRGFYEEALPLFQASVALHPFSIFGHHALGTTLLALHRDKEAAAVYRKFLKEAEGDTLPQNQAVYAKMRNNLGVALLNLNRPQEAEREFREALRLQPGYPEPIKNLQSIGSSNR